MEKLVKKFWAGKKVFITGHTGFKGGWLVETLKLLGAEIKGFSLEPKTSPNFFEASNVADGIINDFGDIRNESLLFESINSFKPEILFHLAAQPLVRYSYEHPKETYEVNVIGTLNVLEAIKKTDCVMSAVLITTDKCYDNKEWNYSYKETDPIGGHDPYSSSKGCCELLISSYRKSFFHRGKARIASARAGNVIGGGDWSEDRLVPDILKAMQKGETPILRNPLAIRPWQHVLEPIVGYIELAQKLFEEEQGFDKAWNFGPENEDCKSVEWVTNFLLKLNNSSQSWKQDANFNPHEAHLLKLDITKAKNQLEWKPKWDLATSLKKTIEWHNNYLLKGDTEIITKNQILEYLDYE